MRTAVASLISLPQRYWSTASPTRTVVSAKITAEDKKRSLEGNCIDKQVGNSKIITTTESAKACEIIVSQGLYKDFTSCLPGLYPTFFNTHLDFFYDKRIWRHLRWCS